MQFEKKFYCYWDMVRLVPEEYLKKPDGSFLTLSVTDGSITEYMVFLGKDEDSSEYEVRIYKSNPNDKYVPSNADNVKRYVENDEFTSFYFDNYHDAHYFTYMFGFIHKEFAVRPIRTITST